MEEEEDDPCLKKKKKRTFWFVCFDCFKVQISKERKRKRIIFFYFYSFKDNFVNLSIYIYIYILEGGFTVWTAKHWHCFVLGKVMCGTRASSPVCVGRSGLGVGPQSDAWPEINWIDQNEAFFFISQSR